jgi:hypothetical protein
MSTLSNQQINQSFQGLLKLADSSTGITQTLQSVQDGLGNDTGVRMGLNFFESPTQLTYSPLGQSTCGIGINSTGAGTANTNVNKLYGHFFFAQKGETYTGLTVSVGTIAAGDDTLEFALYTVGRSDRYGITPKDLVMSGMTLSTSDLSTTGLKTMTLPTPLIFPESGVYFLASLVQSTGTPAVRLRGVFSTTVLSVSSALLNSMYGPVLDTTSVGYFNAFQGGLTSSTFILYGGTDGPFSPSYDPETIGGQASSFNANILGFVFNK